MSEEREKLIDELQYIYDRGSVNIYEEYADFILQREQKLREESRNEGRAEIEKELMAELRDPNGTIWEHAKQLQDENDRLKDKLRLVEEVLKQYKLRPSHYPHVPFIQTENTIDEAIKILGGE